MDIPTIHERVEGIAARFAAERPERQRRRALDRNDFDALADAGFLLTAVPRKEGGLWDGASRSTRPICQLLRALARGDQAVALVASMHPAVLAFWLATERAPEPFADAWATQRERLWRSALDGCWWGTITSEPGSGGDIAKTRAQAARQVDGRYRLTGQKHFGSGSGITSFMMTTAVPDGGSDPDLFFLDVRGVPWDGSRGMKLVAEWDGQGMAATQSHAMAFEDFPVERAAWPGQLQQLARAAGGLIACAFTAVAVGMIDAAYDVAHGKLSDRAAELRPWERVEWTRVELEVWTIRQLFEAMLRAVESDGGGRATLLGKTAIAETAESAMRRICRVVGGGSFSRHSPFGYWFEDIRALGFLRPPWALAFDQIDEGSWESGSPEA